ncbi:MAG: tetratricopeptide repeat protein, partial [Nitrospirota bacterium]|nr:tetratricopeptide repeat protein [Nitrospirota bacterium]
MSEGTDNPGFSVRAAAMLRLTIGCLLLIGTLPDIPAWGGIRTELTSHEVISGFESAFAKGDFPSMKKLAAEHPGRLRLLVDQFLADFSKALVESRTKDAIYNCDLAESIAVLAQELFGDSFSSHQVSRYRTWSRDEHQSKLKADRFYHDARVAFEEGRYGDVLPPGRFALEIYAAIKDDAGEGDTLHYLGQAQRRLVVYSDALSLHNRALDLAVQTSDRNRQGRALIDLGDVYERKKDQAAAKKFYQDALQILNSPADWQEAARALRQIGDVYVATGNFESAYGSYSLALQHAEKAKDDQRIAELNDYLGFCYRSLGDYERAIEHHLRALESAGRISSADLRFRAAARSLNHLGICTAKLAEAFATEQNLSEAARKYREAIAY